MGSGRHRKAEKKVRETEESQLPKFLLPSSAEKDAPQISLSLVLPEGFHWFSTTGHTKHSGEWNV